jgi:hypothetical protein
MSILIFLLSHVYFKQKYDVRMGHIAAVKGETEIGRKKTKW